MSGHDTQDRPLAAPLVEPPVEPTDGIHIVPAEPTGRAEIPDRLDNDRDRTAKDRDETSEAHDETSDARDERADARDERADARDESTPKLDAEAVSDRAGAKRDRQEGATDRKHAQDDREAAATDRALSARERAVFLVDELTGAHRRDAGILELERETTRAKRTNQPFVLAFIDVDRLKPPTIRSATPPATNSYGQSSKASGITCGPTT